MFSPCHSQTKRRKSMSTLFSFNKIWSILIDNNVGLGCPVRSGRDTCKLLILATVTKWRKPSKACGNETNQAKVPNHKPTAIQLHENFKIAYLLQLGTLCTSFFSSSFKSVNLPQGKSTPGEGTLAPTPSWLIESVACCKWHTNDHGLRMTSCCTQVCVPQQRDPRKENKPQESKKAVPSRAKPSACRSGGICKSRTSGTSTASKGGARLHSAGWKTKVQPSQGAPLVPKADKFDHGPIPAEGCKRSLTLRFQQNKGADELMSVMAQEDGDRKGQNKEHEGRARVAEQATSTPGFQISRLHISHVHPLTCAYRTFTWFIPIVRCYFTTHFTREHFLASTASAHICQVHLDTPHTITFHLYMCRTCSFTAILSATIAIQPAFAYWTSPIGEVFVYVAETSPRIKNPPTETSLPSPGPLEASPLLSLLSPFILPTLQKRAPLVPPTLKPHIPQILSLLVVPTSSEALDKSLYLCQGSNLPTFW